MKCKTPEILAFCTEGSEVLLVGKEGIADGTEITLNTGESGITLDGIVVIGLNEPLKYGDAVWCEIDNEDCKARSCTVYVNKISTYCIPDATNKPAGELTGRFLCVESDLYREVYDGDGGVYPGIKVQEDCIFCGGNLPNCLEPPSEVTTFYNITSCLDGLTYQTNTVIAVSNQRVTDSNGKTYNWNGTTQSSATSYVGAVTLVTGQTGCPTVEIDCRNYEVTGGSGGGTYSYVNCVAGTLAGPFAAAAGYTTTICVRRNSITGTNITVVEKSQCYQ